MASLKEHCEDCVRELGEPFEEVHLWLDELFPVLKEKHRDARHHSGGIQQIIEKWGKKAGKAAEIHILKDCGKIPTEKEAQMWNLFRQ